MSKLRRGTARLIDSYADGLINKQEFEPRVTRMRERIQHLEEQPQHLKEESEVEEELCLILGRLETFAAKVKAGLQDADFQTRRRSFAHWLNGLRWMRSRFAWSFASVPPCFPPLQRTPPTILPIVGGVYHRPLQQYLLELDLPVYVIDGQSRQAGMLKTDKRMPLDSPTICTIS